MKKIVSVLFISLLFTSCEKVVELNYKSNRSNIVIEGNITNLPGPYFVKLTNSISLSGTGSYPTIDNAVVTLGDDAGNIETLTPQGNGVYSTSTINGVEGRTYTLTVTIGIMVYTAQSTMQQQVPFNSIKVETVKVAGELNRDIIPVYLDPVAEGNNYRFVLWVNNKFINQHLLQNDETRNGVENNVKLEINDEDFKFKSGDQITIAMQCIDKQVALYYNTLALMSDSGPGGGTTPNNPPNNISNGALGIFSAHTVETKSTTIP